MAHSETVDYLVALSGQELQYDKTKLVLATMIVAWITWLGVTAAVILSSLAARHIHKYGAERTVSLVSDVQKLYLTRISMSWSFSDRL